MKLDGHQTPWQEAVKWVQHPKESPHPGGGTGVKLGGGNLPKALWGWQPKKMHSGWDPSPRPHTGPTISEEVKGLGGSSEAFPRPSSPGTPSLLLVCAFGSMNMIEILLNIKMS